MPNSATPPATAINASAACACTTARKFPLSIRTFAIADPAALVYEPAGVVTMLTVCAPADVVSESTTAADAPSVEIFICVIPSGLSRRTVAARHASGNAAAGAGSFGRAGDRVRLVRIY